MLIRTRESRPGVLTRMLRSAGGLWFPDFDVFAAKHMNILAVLGKPEGKHIIPASNIVTDAGDLHYAQRAVAEALTNAFAVHEMASAGPDPILKTHNRSSFTMIASSEKATAASYPTRDDGDADNTGADADIVTHLVSYLTTDFDHAAITHGIITNATPGASEPILTGYAFAAAFEKSASDTLKVFVNHEMSGV